MELPVVTVICLCYNQGRFVREAIDSVLKQTYPRVQLIVVDDASTDHSVEVIRECVEENPEIKFLPLPVNVGNCRAFNIGLSHAAGDFIIDLAADDVLLPERIAQGVKDLDGAGSDFGVNFTDALWINEAGEFLRKHSDRFPHESVPTGDIYRDIIARFFICSPTMMFRREVIQSLNGYDESLAYEDFDFLIRSSRKYKYHYSPKVSVKKRVVNNSMSKKQFSYFSSQLKSTFIICEKILALNRSSEEQRALSKRILYEMRVCLKLFHFPLLCRYAKLYVRNSGMRFPG